MERTEAESPVSGQVPEEAVSMLMDWGGGWDRDNAAKALEELAPVLCKAERERAEEAERERDEALERMRVQEKRLADERDQAAQQERERIREAALSDEAQHAAWAAIEEIEGTATPSAGVLALAFRAAFDAVRRQEEEREFTHCPECDKPNGTSPDCDLCGEYRSTAAAEHQAAEQEIAGPLQEGGSSGE